jgi:hypothetical protein
MSEHSLNDKHDDAEAYLDRAIRAAVSEPVPREARSRAVESAMSWQHSQHGAKRAQWFAAAAAVLLIAAASIYALYGRRAPETNTADTQDSPSRAKAHGASNHSNIEARESDAEKPIQIAAKWTSSIQVAVAQNAPVMIANGGKSPIHLGARVPQREAGGSLHIWDWSQSPISRVVSDVELWSNDRIAISPDGKLLVWARGEILDLETLERTPIDLGGEAVQVGEATYGRIGDMQFSPDGGRLALLIGSKVQIVQFPSGKLLGDFLAGEDYSLRIAFSADGKHVVSGNRSREVAIYDATTGEELQQLSPALDSQIMGVAISADGTYVTAYERTEFSRDPAEERYGDLLIWRTASGELAHRISGAQLRKLGGAGPSYGALQFSPDSKYLAAESWGRIFVIDVATGEIAAALNESAVQSIQWAADGKTITTIAPLVGSDGEGDMLPGRYDVYPAMNEWNWRDGKKVRSFDASQARAQSPAGE